MGTPTFNCSVLVFVSLITFYGNFSASKNEVLQFLGGLLKQWGHIQCLLVHRWIAVILGMLGDLNSVMPFTLLSGCCWALEVFRFLLINFAGQVCSFFW